MRKESQDGGRWSGCSALFVLSELAEGDSDRHESDDEPAAQSHRLSWTAWYGRNGDHFRYLKLALERSGSAAGGTACSRKIMENPPLDLC